MKLSDGKLPGLFQKVVEYLDLFNEKSTKKLFLATSDSPQLLPWQPMTAISLQKSEEVIINFK